MCLNLESNQTEQQALNLLTQFSSDYYPTSTPLPSTTPNSDTSAKVAELEREISQLTNKVLCLQNENSDLKLVQVADNHDKVESESPGWGSEQEPELSDDNHESSQV